MTKSFTKFFEKGLKGTYSGNLNITIQFNRLFVEEKKTDLGSQGGRKRYYYIHVDYMADLPSGQHRIVSDSLTLDSIDFDLSGFCKLFFMNSLKKLDEVIEHADYTSFSIQQKKESGSGQYIKPQQISFKLKKNGTIKFKEEVPPTTVREAINHQFINQPHGTYVIRYRLKSATPEENKEKKYEVTDISTLEYKQSSISRFWYFTVPVLILVGVSSGMSN